MRNTFEGRRRSSNPIDVIRQMIGADKHVVIASKRTGEAHEYRGFASQADYFSLARGMTTEDNEAFKKLLPSDSMVVLTCPMSEKIAWDQDGIEETAEALDADTISGREDISGGDPDVIVNRDDMAVRSIARRKRRAPAKRKTVARKPKATE